MSPNELSARIDTIVDKAESKLNKAATAAQKELFSEMQILLSKLELDQDGLIKQSQANRKILQKADKVFDRAIKDSGYYIGLSSYAESIGDLTAVNEKYFSTILDTFTIDAQYLKSLQKSTISTIESLLANDGLASQVKQPLLQILNQNVNTSASLSDMLKQVREFAVGSPDRDGKLLRYSKQIGRDAIFDYSRSFQESISENAGLEFYMYSGGIMDDSRPFCVERSNKFYHKKEVESWAKLTWAGKRPGTTSSTIFVFAGGFSCRHSLIPVSKSIVPDDVIERAKEKGLI